jgi:hypothetical protein
MELLERIQATWISEVISQSTWGYPIVGALHVLAIALFGGALLVGNVEEVRRLESWAECGPCDGSFTVRFGTGALLREHIFQNQDGFAGSRSRE